MEREKNKNVAIMLRKVKCMINRLAGRSNIPMVDSVGGAVLVHHQDLVHPGEDILGVGHG